MTNRILILNSSNKFWGAEVSLTILLKSLHPDQYKLVVRTEGSGLESELAYLGIRHLSYDLELSPFKKNFFLSIFRLLKEVFQSKAKIIYANNEDLSTLVATLKVVTLFRLKTKLHIRNTPSRYDYYKKLMFIHDDVICNSVFTKNVLVKGINFYFKKKIHVVPNSHGQIAKDVLIPKDRDDYFLTVGMVNERKAQFDVVKVFNEAGTKLRAKYMMLGDYVGSNPYLEKIKRYLDKNKLQKKVVIYPFKRDLSVIYKGAIATIISSTNETFGRVVIESGYYGTPVIVRNIEPLVEIIEDGHNGLVWDGSEDHLLQLLLRLSEDSTYRDFLGENLKKLVITKFGDDKYSKSVKEIILGKKR